MRLRDSQSQSWLPPELLIFLLVLANVVQCDRISKCHHEGDINLNCDKKNMPRDTPELIRSAKLINGLYYNDSLCSFVPGTSCYRQLSLNECIDKSSCLIKNSWYSLEPECSGNSYYAQVEYECQPSYHICDSPTVINNVFSGVIYSPHYPGSFRTESNTPCFLTIQVPKKHHIQITLDYFNLLLTKSCVGDYLEIQEYIKEKSNFKWKTLGTMCGERSSKFTLRAMSDIINIKFRPLEFGHHFLRNVQNKKFGFKIYFEAVPPDAPVVTVPTIAQSPLSTFESKTTKPSIDIAQDQDKTSYRSSSLALILIVISIVVIIVIVVVIGLVIWYMRRMKINKTEQNSNHNSTSAPLLNTKKPISKNEIDESPIPNTIPSTKPPVTTPPMSVHVGGSDTTPSVKPAAPKPAIVNKTKVIVEEEPRKMKTELPALLQDLGTSKLLLKFQQQQSLSSTKNETSEIDSSKKNEKQERDIEIKESLDPKTPTESNNVESSSPKKELNLTFEESGIYDGTNNQNDAKEPLTEQTSEKLQLTRKPSSKSLKKNRKNSTKSLVKANSTEQTSPSAKVEIIENNKVDLLTITHIESLNQQDSVDFDDGKFADFIETKLEIIEETNSKDKKAAAALPEVPNDNKNLVTFTLPSFPNRTSTICSTDEGSPKKISQKQPTTPRKSNFNPLHVILKDKNKYYTTEYI